MSLWIHRGPHAFRFRSPWPGLAAVLLLCAMAVSPCRANVISWMNDQIEGLLEVEGGQKGPDVSGYLKHLDDRTSADWSARRVQQMTGPEDSRNRTGRGGRAEEWEPRISDGLTALRSRSGQMELRALEETASRTAMLSSRIGFLLPSKILANAAMGTDPLRKLLVSYEQALNEAGSQASLDRMHRAAEKLMGQVQNNHHLIQQAREGLAAAGRLLERARAFPERSLAAAGEVQAVPLVAAFLEVHLRARSNLESASSYLVRAQADLKSIFHLARSVRSHLEKAKARAFGLRGATFTLRDTPRSVESLSGALARMRGAVTKAMQGMQTADGLLDVNRKALIELLYTLRPREPVASLRAPSLEGVTQGMARAEGLLDAGIREARIDLARQRSWTESLESYRTPLFELGALPTWVFKRDTILLDPVGRLAAPRPDINRIMSSLGAPPAPGGTAPDVTASRPMPGVEPGQGTPEAGYKLPRWY